MATGDAMSVERLARFEIGQVVDHPVVEQIFEDFDGTKYRLRKSVN